MKNTLITLTLVSLLFACDSNDPPVETSVVYPLSYVLTDYDLADPNYAVLEENNETSTVAPSTTFMEYLNYFEEEEISESYRDFSLAQRFVLKSDTILDVIVYDFVDNQSDTTELNYQKIDNEIIIDVPNYQWVVEHDVADDRLVDCGVYFTHTRADATSGEVEYVGFDIDPCLIHSNDDYLASYLSMLNGGFLTVGDTLAFAKITYLFDRE